MTTNVLLQILAPLLAAPIADIKASLANIITTPTIVTVTTEGEKLALDALNPTNLTSGAIGPLAQEAMNIINAIEAHLMSAVAAPTVVPAATA